MAKCKIQYTYQLLRNENSKRVYSAYQPYFKRWNYHPKKFLKGNPRTNFREKKRTNNKKNTKTKDGFARRLVAAYNFDALFAITLIPFEFLHVRLVYLIKYIRRADLISIHEICVAITLFKVHFITWLGEIDIGYFLTRAHARESPTNAPQLSEL